MKLRGLFSSRTAGRSPLKAEKASVAAAPTAAVAADGGEIAVISINGKKFVTGLFWSPLTRARAYMAEARELGKRHDWDIVAIRRSAMRMQAGFVSRSRGALKGMYSLASALAGVLGEKWIGAFDVGGNRYAIVAVHDGTIVPGYDRLVQGFEEAKSVMEHGIALLDFGDNVYAPKAFNLALQERSLADLLTPKRLHHDYRLRQLKFGMTRKELGMLAAVLLIAGGAIYGYGVWQEHREQLRRAEEKRLAEIRLAQLKLLEEQSKRSQPAQALEHPWAHMPTAVAFADGCRDRSRLTPLSIEGWAETSSTCNGSAHSAVYERLAAGRTVGEFRLQAVELCNGLIIEDAASKATLTCALSLPPAGDESLMDATDARLRIASEIQRWGDDVATLTNIQSRAVALPPRQQPLAGQTTPSPPPPPVPTWREFTFEFKTGLPPSVHAENLKDVPGLRFTSIDAKIKRDDASIEWTVKGDLYANL